MYLDMYVCMMETKQKMLFDTFIKWVFTSVFILSIFF